MPEEMLTLRVAAERSGESETRLSRWCATGRLRCERDGGGWLIPLSELAVVTRVAREHATAVDEKRVAALLIPLPTVPQNLADEVASRLGVGAGNVSVTPLVLDGVEYVVAVWPGEVSTSGGLPALRELASELDADLLDREVTGETFLERQDA